MSSMNYEKMTVAELRKTAKELGITIISEEDFLEKYGIEGDF